MKIVVAIDYSPVSGRQLREARKLAKGREAEIFLLHVEPPEPDFVGYEPGPQHVRDAVAQEAMEHHAELRAMKDQVAGPGITAHALVIQGPAPEKILSEAERLEADVLVLGSHGHGALHDLLLGSVSQAVLHGAACPVLVVPSRLGRE